MLYIASRDSTLPGENTGCEAMEAAADMAGKLRIRDEVDRRVSIVETAKTGPARILDQGWPEHIRQAPAELRSLAGTVSDPLLARQPDIIGNHRCSGSGSRRAPEAVHRPGRVAGRNRRARAFPWGRIRPRARWRLQPVGGAGGPEVMAISGDVSPNARLSDSAHRNEKRGHPTTSEKR